MFDYLAEEGSKINFPWIVLPICIVLFCLLSIGKSIYKYMDIATKTGFVCGIISLLVYLIFSIINHYKSIPIHGGYLLIICLCFPIISSNIVKLFFVKNVER